MKPTILRRIGPHPHEGKAKCSGRSGCPEVFELSTGDFAVIGIDQTEQLRDMLPKDASCGSDERIVVVDRHILVRAKQHIPED